MSILNPGRLLEIDAVLLGGVEHKEYELRLFLVALTLFFLSLGEERENL